MPGREFLFVTKEAVPGVFDDEAAAADKFVIRLDRANAFNALDTPVQWRLNDAAGSNRTVQTGNEQVTSTGSLATIAYPTQAPLLAGWGCNLIGDPYEQYTLTFDHGRIMEDASDTLVLERYVGCKNQTYKLAANNSGDGVVARSEFTFMHMGRSTITSTDRPTPSLSTYPTVKPYVFQDLKGGLILRTTGSSVRTHFASVEINVNNIIFPFFDEDRYPSRLSWRGRSVGANIKFRLENLTDREAMLAAAANEMSLLFSSGVTPNQYTLKFDFHDQVRVMTAAEDRPLDGGFYNNLTTLGMIDLAAGTDLTLTATGPL